MSDNENKISESTKGLVSVIVPVYNGEAFIEACLYSILGQTYRNLEIIVVDDGSIDNTSNILQRIAVMDPRMRVLHSENRGVSAARNLALDNAEGEFITMIDADDMLHPQAVEIFLDLIEKTGVDMASACYVNSASHVFENVDTPHDVKVYDWEKATQLTLYQRRGMNPSPCCKLFRTEVIGEIRFLENTRYEDLEIIPRIYERCARGVAFCSDVLYFYRHNSRSFINTVSRTRLDVLKVTANIENRMRANNRPRLLRAAKDRRLSACFNMFFLCEGCGWKEDADACWRIIRRYRMSTLFNWHTRMRNKLGALLSLPGRRFLCRVGRLTGELR